MCSIVSGSFGTYCFIRIQWESAVLAGITSSSPSKISYAEMRDCCIHMPPPDVFRVLAEALVQTEPPPSHRHLPAPTRRPRPFLNLRFVPLNRGWSGKASSEARLRVIFVLNVNKSLKWEKVFAVRKSTVEAGCQSFYSK